jgi:hypothetical protein
MTPPLIHIGLHKTGTTWMQMRLFVDREIGFDMPWPRGRERAILMFVNAPPFSFDAQATRQAFAEGMAECERQGLVPVISHEGLSGRPIEGIYDGHSVAQRLHSVFPEGRVLITIREQRSMMKSLYRQYIRQRGIGGPEHFFERDDYGQIYYQLCRVHHLEYHHMIDYYQKLFSPAQVLVLPFEMLRNSPTEFSRSICEHAGLTLRKEPSMERDNVGMRGGVLEAMRRLNRWLPARFGGRRDALEAWLIRRHRLLDRLFNGPKVEHRLNAFVDDYARNRFTESNAITAQLIGHDLKGYGYL